MKSALLAFAIFHSQSASPALPIQQPSVDLPPELSRVLRDYEKGWSKGDGKALAQLFTEDGYVMQPNRQPIKGREAIEKAYQSKGAPLALRAIAYGYDGSVGYILGAFAEKAGDPDRGKFTLTLKKVDGKWLIASDMDNSSLPRFGGG